MGPIPPAGNRSHEPSLRPPARPVPVLAAFAQAPRPTPPPREHLAKRSRRRRSRAAGAGRVAGRLQRERPRATGTFRDRYQPGFDVDGMLAFHQQTGGFPPAAAARTLGAGFGAGAGAKFRNRRAGDRRRARGQPLALDINLGGRSRPPTCRSRDSTGGRDRRAGGEGRRRCEAGCVLRRAAGRARRRHPAATRVGHGRPRCGRCR